MLAGIPVDHVTRLEQGRASHPSSQVVEALTRALQPSGTRRGHLSRLAGLTPPDPETVPAHLTPSVQRVLDRLTATPVAVYDATWTPLLANPPYAALMGAPSGWRGNQRDGAWRDFLGPSERVRHTPRSRRDLEAALVAELWESGGSAGSPPLARCAAVRRIARSATPR
ncbi:hypothetical protein GCM10009753_51550 [Streptantibioticus ferralitis]